MPTCRRRTRSGEGSRRPARTPGEARPRCELSIPSDTDSSRLSRRSTRSRNTGTCDHRTSTSTTSVAVRARRRTATTTPTVHRDRRRSDVTGAERVADRRHPGGAPCPPGAPVPATDALITAANFVVVPIEIDVSRASWPKTLRSSRVCSPGVRLILVSGVAARVAGRRRRSERSSRPTIYVLRDSARPAPAEPALRRRRRRPTPPRRRTPRRRATLLLPAEPRCRARLRLRAPRRSRNRSAASGQFTPDAAATRDRRPRPSRHGRRFLHVAPHYERD